ncbi:hypothetical protein M885DRAFT_558970 [Pelagophyceae sp. CCMP2097]|nr:hypothetical protein M885DRAFT_558970 [Pelagophyceae sp. CCMP2097]
MAALTVHHDGLQPSVEIGTLLCARLNTHRAALLSDAPLLDSVAALQTALAATQTAVLLVTSEADGTVCRNVRKVVRELRGRGDAPGAPGAGADEAGLAGVRCVVILLGQARCANSAASTKSTVFGSGRLLQQLLASKCGAQVPTPPSNGFFEADVELEDVEAAVAKWADFLLDEEAL